MKRFNDLNELTFMINQLSRNREVYLQYLRDEVQTEPLIVYHRYYRVVNHGYGTTYQKVSKSDYDCLSKQPVGDGVSWKIEELTLTKHQLLALEVLKEHEQQLLELYLKVRDKVLKLDNSDHSHKVRALLREIENGKFSAMNKARLEALMCYLDNYHNNPSAYDKLKTEFHHHNHDIIEQNITYMMMAIFFTYVAFFSSMLIILILAFILTVTLGMTVLNPGTALIGLGFVIMALSLFTMLFETPLLYLICNETSDNRKITSVCTAIDYQNNDKKIYFTFERPIHQFARVAHSICHFFKPSPLERALDEMDCLPSHRHSVEVK